MPGYLINLKAEFSIGNEIVATENAGTMGTDLYETLGYWDPQRGWDVSQNTPTAGVYQVIGLDLQGSSPEYAAKLQANLEATKAKLESADEAQLQNLTKHDLVGDMLEATIFSYFAMNNLQDDITAQQANIISYRQPSYGKFSTSLTTSYWFGMPRNVSAAGLVMDVDRVLNSKVDKDNDVQNRINFNQMTGSRLSAMEHLIPEQMFSTEKNQAQGISAVKAIALASAAGQKIWTITQNNLELALTEMSLPSDTETEIRNSVNAGMVVTAHEQQVNFNGWVGEGYIVLDPDTGAGAYKIAGGGNGGWLSVVLDGIQSILGGLAYLSNRVGITDLVLSFIRTIVNCSNGIVNLIENNNSLVAGILFTLVIFTLAMLVFFNFFAIFLALQVGTVFAANVGFFSAFIVNFALFTSVNNSCSAAGE